MKKNLFFLTVIFFSSFLNAQVKNFMPLAIGNEYQYYDGYNYAFTILEKDTIYPNGKHYFQYPITGMFGDIRVDSLGNIWDGSKILVPLPSKPDEYLIFKADAQLDEQWVVAWDHNIHPEDSVYGKIVFDDTINVFGEPRHVKGVRISDGAYPLVWFWLAEGIGIIHYAYDDGSEASMIYAKIDDKVYGKYVPVSVEKENTSPNSFEVSQNYPNPFNPSTNINITIPGNTSDNIKFMVFDILGKKIAEKSYFVSGSTTISFNASEYNLTSGLYLYTVTYNNKIITKKFTLLK